MTRARTLLLCLLVLGLTLACFAPIEPRPDLGFDPASLPAGRTGVPYEATIRVVGHVTPVIGFVIAEGSLPGGLTLEYHERDDFARITGTPTQAGTFTFKLTAYCQGTNVSGQMGENEFTMVVIEQP